MDWRPVGWGLWTGGLWAGSLQTGGLQAGGCGLGHNLDTREPGKDRLGWQWEQDWRQRLTAPYPDCCVTTAGRFPSLIWIWLLLRSRWTHGGTTVTSEVHERSRGGQRRAQAQAKELDQLTVTPDKPHTCYATWGPPGDLPDLQFPLLGRTWPQSHSRHGMVCAQRSLLGGRGAAGFQRDSPDAPTV